MFDASFRRHLTAPLDRVGGVLADRGVAPTSVTLLGLAVGVGACVAVALEQWWLGILLWLVNRLADGLDGPIARHLGPTDLGGFVDIMADFAIYGGMVVAIGFAQPEARVACLALFLGYYLSGSSFLAFSSLATKREVAGDGRSLNFPAGLAEGSETIAAYVIILALPAHTELLIWIWTAIVGITFLQRIGYVTRLLRS